MSTSGKSKERSSIESVTEGKTSPATKAVALVTTGIATESSTTSIDSATTDKAPKAVISFLGTTTPIPLGNYTKAASTVLYSTIQGTTTKIAAEITSQGTKSIDSKTTALTSKETTTATSIDASTMPSSGTSSIAKPWTSVVGRTEDTVKSKEETTLSTTVTIKEEPQASIDSATTQTVTENVKTQNTQSTKLTSDTHVENMSTSASTVSTDVTKVTVVTTVEESTILSTAATSDTKITITAVSDVVTTSYIGPTVDFTTKNDSSSVSSSLDPNTLPAAMTSEVSSLWSTVAEEAGKTKETVISTSTDTATISAGRSLGSTSSHLFMTKITTPPLQVTTPGTQAEAGLTSAPTSENYTVAATVQAFMTSTQGSAKDSESTPATEKTLTSSGTLALLPSTKGATEPISQHKEFSPTMDTQDETTQSKGKEVIISKQFTEFTTLQKQSYGTYLETTLPMTTQSSKGYITKPFTITSESLSDLTTNPFKETTEKQVETTVNTIIIHSTEVLTGPTSMIPTSRDISKATGTMVVDLPTEYKGTSTLSTSLTTVQALATTTDLTTPVNTVTKQDSTISADVQTNAPFTDKPFRVTSPPATKELIGASTSKTMETFSGIIGTSNSTLTVTQETTNVTVGSQLAKTISIKATQETTPKNQTTQEGMSRAKEFTTLSEPSERTSETTIFTNSKPANEVVTPSREGSITQGTTEKITAPIKATFSSHKEVTNSPATGEYKEPTTIKSTTADVSSTTVIKKIGMTVRDEILASPASHLGSAKEKLTNITKSTAVPGTTTKEFIKDITKEITGTTLAESVKITTVEKGVTTMEHTTTTGAQSSKITPLIEANTTPIITSTHTETVTASLSTESRGDTISVISTVAQPTMTFTPEEVTKPEKGTRGLDVTILTANVTLGITTEATAGIISRGETETTLKMHPGKITTILPRSTMETTYKTPVLTSKEAHIAGTTTQRLTAGSDTIIPTTIKVQMSESTATTELVKSSEPELVTTAGNTTAVLATVTPTSTSNTTMGAQTTESSTTIKITKFMTTEPKTPIMFKNTTTAMAAATVTSAPTTKTTKMLQTFESISTAKITDIKSTEITIKTTTSPDTFTSTSTTSSTTGGQTVESFTKEIVSTTTTHKIPIIPETTTLKATTNTTTISHTAESNTASEIAETLPTTSIMLFTTGKITSSLAPSTATTAPTTSTTKVTSSTEYNTTVKTTKIPSVKSKAPFTAGTSMSAPITNATLEAHPTKMITTGLSKSTTTEPKGPFTSEITTVQLSTDTVTPAPPINITLAIHTSEAIITSKSTTESKQEKTTQVLETTFDADIPISTENTIFAKQATTLKALVKMATSVLAGSSKIPSVQQTTEPAVKKGNFSETKMAMHTTDSTADFAHTRQATSGVPTTISTTVTKVTAEQFTEVTKVSLPFSRFQVTENVFPTETKTVIIEKTSATTQPTTTKSIPRSTLELIKGLTMPPERNVTLHSTTDAKGTVALVGEVSTQKVDSVSVTGKTTVGTSKTTTAGIVTIAISKATVPGIGAARDITTGSTTNITKQTAGKVSTVSTQKGEATSPKDTTSKPLITSSGHIGLIISTKATERAVNATVSATTIRSHINITESSTAITKTTRGQVTSSLIPNTTKPGTISINATVHVNVTTPYHIGNITIVLIAVNTSLPTNITMPPGKGLYMCTLYIYFK